MSYLIEGLFPVDLFIDDLRNLVDNGALAAFHMTVGEIAAAILAANDVDEYKGDNAFVFDLIDSIQSRVT